MCGILELSHLLFCADSPDPWLVHSTGWNGTGWVCSFFCFRVLLIPLQKVSSPTSHLWLVALTDYSVAWQLSWAPDNHQHWHWKPPLCQVKKHFISFENIFLQNKQNLPSYHFILQLNLLNTIGCPPIPEYMPGVGLEIVSVSP